MDVVTINDKKYSGKEKTFKFKTPVGNEVSITVTQSVYGGITMTASVDKMKVTNAKAWVDSIYQGDKEEKVVAFRHNDRKVAVLAPADIIDEILSMKDEKTEWMIDRDAEWKRHAQLAIVNGGSYYVDYDICEVVPADVWTVSPYSRYNESKTHYQGDDEPGYYYIQHVASLKDFYAAGWTCGDIHDYLDKMGVKLSGHCATYNGAVYIVNSATAKAVADKAKEEKTKKEAADIEKEYEDLAKAKSDGQVLPQAEITRLSKNYDIAFNEGGEGFNPYHYYISKEYYDSFMARYYKTNNPA